MEGIDRFIRYFTGYGGEFFREPTVEAGVHRCLELVGRGPVGLSENAARMLSDVLNGYEIQWVTEMPASPINTPDIGITTALGLVAETGSLVIDDHDTGERLWSLVPPVHIALIIRPRVFHTLDELFSDPLPGDGICLVSGPSRTADIEKQVVLGMHGPKRVIAVVVM